MADPRDPPGRLVRDTWVRVVREKRPGAKASWMKTWDELDPADPDDAFQIEADAEIEKAVIRAYYREFTTLAELRRQIDDLRGLEREYRSRLLAFHEAAVRELREGSTR